MNKKKIVREPTLAELAAQQQQENDADMASKMENTVAGEIWNEIKDLKIEMFSLPNQFVHMHCHPVMIEPSKLYLTVNSSAVLPSLEVAVGSKFTADLEGKFVTVARNK
jgi:hypothetical protein